MLHGDRTPRQRSAALEGFSAGRLGVLVASDVAARGLHVPGIRLVVNYDLPLSPEEWVHRVGRAAHGGGVGGSISFRGEDEAERWRAIAKLAGLSLDAEPTPKELLVAIAPRDRSRSTPALRSAKPSSPRTSNAPKPRTGRTTSAGGKPRAGHGGGGAAQGDPRQPRAAGAGRAGAAGGKRTMEGRGARIGRKSAARKPPPKGTPRRSGASGRVLRPGSGVRRLGEESTEAS